MYLLPQSWNEDKNAKYLVGSKNLESTVFMPYRDSNHEGCRQGHHDIVQVLIYQQWLVKSGFVG